LTDNNNENANLLIIAYQYFSDLISVFTIKNTANIAVFFCLIFIIYKSTNA